MHALTMAFQTESLITVPGVLWIFCVVHNRSHLPFCKISPWTMTIGTILADRHELQCRIFEKNRFFKDLYTWLQQVQEWSGWPFSIQLGFGVKIRSRLWYGNTVRGLEVSSSSQLLRWRMTYAESAMEGEGEVILCGRYWDIGNSVCLLV